jgi:hypothetical protein
VVEKAPKHSSRFVVAGLEGAARIHICTILYTVYRTSVYCRRPFGIVPYHVGTMPCPTVRNHICTRDQPEEKKRKAQNTNDNNIGTREDLQKSQHHTTSHYICIVSTVTVSSCSSSLPLYLHKCHRVQPQISTSQISLYNSLVAPPLNSLTHSDSAPPITVIVNPLTA